MREAGLVVASIHEALRGAIRPGITTRELDEVSAQAIVDGGSDFQLQGLLRLSGDGVHFRERRDRSRHPGRL